MYKTTFFSIFELFLTPRYHIFQSLGMDDNAVDITGSQASHVSEGGDDFKVRCPCGCNEVRMDLILKLKAVIITIV